MHLHFRLELSQRDHIQLKLLQRHMSQFQCSNRMLLRTYSPEKGLQHQLMPSFHRHHTCIILEASSYSLGRGTLRHRIRTFLAFLGDRLGRLDQQLSQGWHMLVHKRRYHSLHTLQRKDTCRCRLDRRISRCHRRNLRGKQGLEWSQVGKCRRLNC